MGMRAERDQALVDLEVVRAERNAALARLDESAQLLREGRDLLGELRQELGQPRLVVANCVPPWKVRQELLELAVGHIANGYSQVTDPVEVARGFYNWVKPSRAEQGIEEQEVPAADAGDDDDVPSGSARCRSGPASTTSWCTSVRVSMRTARRWCTCRTFGWLQDSHPRWP